MKFEFDTIAAISTPLATGGVGIIRISGGNAFHIMANIFKGTELAANKVSYGYILDKNSIIDEVIVISFKSPKSFTGEDVVEIHCHGGVQVVKRILELCLKNGARLAERGEFSKRAFLNGKKDLTQTEAILDLINSKTDKAVAASAQSLSGSLKRFIGEAKESLISILSTITASIDFPEDVPEPNYNQIEEVLNSLLFKVNKTIKHAGNSNLLRQGIKIAVVGCPNVGKSSLFNALLNMQRAIVTDIAGTTRDTISETIDINGIPATLIDTAGIRETQDIVESIGVDMAKDCIKQSDIVLFLTDLTEEINEEDLMIKNSIENEKIIFVGTKSDIAKDRVNNEDFFKISSITGEGLEELKKEISEKAGLKTFEDMEFMLNSRQVECLRRAQEALKTSLQNLQANELPDFISIDLKTALIALGEATGETVTEELLDNIFSNFCIGK